MAEATVTSEADTPVGLVAAGLAVVGAVGAVVAWLATGVAASVPVAVVGGLAVAAAICDARTGRIPNALVLVGLTVIGFAWAPVAVVDDRMMGELARDLAAGCLLGGAPLLFAVWLVAPRLVGGGDWKLLGVCGLALGYLAPLSAVVMVMVGFAIAILVAAAIRCRTVLLGPMLAAGYVTAVVVAVTSPVMFGSAYS